jgi:hypothetical protein
LRSITSATSESNLKALIGFTSRRNPARVSILRKFDHTTSSSPQHFRTASYRDIVYQRPFDTLGNHRRHFGLAIRYLFRTVSVVSRLCPGMKFIEPRPFADPDAAARKLVEFANATEVVQDGRIYIELINAQFLKAGGTPEQFRAALDRAIARRWLERHESGTYVKFTQAGAELFA